jgi:rod shape-determining protein MreC
MFRRPSTPVFLLTLLAICVVLTAWSQRARGQGSVSLPDSVALGVMRPAQRTLTGVGAWFMDVGRVMVRRGDILQENAELQRRIADLDNRNKRLLRYQQENRELRQMLKIPPPASGRLIAAEVVSRDATDYARRVIINAGAPQGVRAKDVVFNAQGVIGQVIEVDNKYGTATVLLLTDRMSGVGAMVQRTAARGLLQGTGHNTCHMTYLDLRADVREGDLIVTSGDSRIFPKGLVLGRALRVRKDKTYSQTSAEIEPAARLDQLSAVWVRVQAGP